MGLEPTLHLYQTEQARRDLDTTLSSLQPLPSLSDADQALFKTLPAERATHVLTTPATIFHPQGGGQPSDEGSITLKAAGQSPAFNVSMARTSTESVSATKSTVLHAGFFPSADNVADVFCPGAEITQSIDDSKRALYSRLHTAGHLIGLAVRLLVQAGKMPEGVSDDGKASHFPGSASVECEGLIPGDKKAEIQQMVDQLVSKDLEVRVEVWSLERCKAEGVLIPDGFDASESGGVRVVDVEGIGAYMCGGTHLPRTTDVGEVVVKKISRQKGISRISYEIKPM